MYQIAPVVEKEETVINPLVQEELDYYFDRHNVEDEGYEMVVAFANGRRLQMNADHHLSVRNIGTWEGHQRKGTAIVLDT